MVNDPITILLLEDNPGDVVLMREALSESSFRHAKLFVANTVKEATKFTSEKITILLVDLGLPDSNGLETVQTMQSIYPNSCLIVLTGLADEKIAVETLREGAQNYLSKDEIDSRLISKTILFSLERHQILQKLKATEKELLQSKELVENSEARLIEAQAVAKVGSWETDLLTLGVIWSAETYRIFEVDRAHIDVNHTTFLSFVHPADKVEFDKAFKESFNNRDLNTIEHRIITGIKTEKWVLESWRVFSDEKGKPFRAAGTCQDITELKKAEELKEFERREKEALINNTEDLIWSVTKDYKLIAANHAFLYAMQLSSNVTLKPGDSLMLHDVFTPDYLAFWKDLYNQALLGKSFKREVHSPPSLKSEESWMEISFNPIFNGDQVESVACYGRNITERKNAEAILTASEVKYKKLFANNPAPMIIWDFETHQLIDCNEEALLKYEYTREEFLNLQIEDLRPEEDRLLIRQATQTEETYGEIHKKIWRHKKKNGEIMFMDVTGHLIDYNDRRAALVMLIDVTEKQKTEEKIRKSELELREAQKLAQLGSWNFDFLVDRLTWSDELYNVFDTDHKTFQETHGSFVHLVDEQDREFVRQTSLRTQQAGTPFNIEYTITTKKGEKRVIHEMGYAERNKEGKIIRLFGTAQNITESKKAQEQVKTEKLFSDSLINSLPGIFYLYDRSGKFTRWNKNFETISGYSQTEIDRMHPFDFYDEDEKHLIKNKIETVFTRGSDEMIAHFYTKDKNKIPYYFTGHKISLYGNDYLIGVGVDVTERTRAEKELQEYTREIQKLTAYLDQVREEERTRIAREIHDELGQQLTGLKMDASWIAKKIPSDDKPLQAKISGMIGILDETVKSVRRISTDLRPGMLDDLGLIAALEWQSNEFEKRSEIKCEFKSVVEDWDIDRQLATSIFRIYQEALTNVMRHAKATHIEASVKKTETEFALIIKDDGQGFNSEAVKEKQTLGLIGMRERALMGGGELSIISEINKGTLVILRIPLKVINARK